MLTAGTHQAVLWLLVVLKWMMLCEQGRMWRGEEARQQTLELRLQAVRGLLGRALQMWRRLLVWLLGKRWWHCLLYTSPSPRDRTRSRMPSSA